MKTSTFLGMTNRVALSADETDGTLGIIDISVQPGVGVPLHTNTVEALSWYVIDGTLSFERDGGLIQVTRGGAVFLPRGEKQTFMNMSDSPARALLVCVPGGFEGFLLELSGKLPADVPPGPPSPEATQVMVGAAERYGIEIHLESSTV